MIYNKSYFDEVIPRKNTHSVKWDELEKRYGDDDIIAMWIADTDFRAPAELIDALVKRAAHGIFGYAITGQNYTQYPVDWHKKRNNIEYSTNNIVFSKNVLTSLGIAIKTLTNVNENIVILTPTYKPFENVSVAASRKTVSSKLIEKDGKYFVDFEDFEKTIVKSNAKLYILCNPHNPCGRVWSREELETMLLICKKHDVAIISDEIHSDLIMPGYTFTPLMQIAREQDYTASTVVLSSPTKTFNIAGIQVAYYICENPELSQRLSETEKMSGTNDDLSSFSYIALQEVYTHGEAYLQELIKYIHNNYIYFCGELEKHCPLAKIADLEATYLAWVDISALTTESGLALREAMVKQGVAIQEGTCFSETEKNCFRVNLALPMSVLKKGVAAIVKCLNDFPAK